jgi:hypothetical protein
MSKRSKARARAYERKQALAAARAHKPAPPALAVVTGTRKPVWVLPVCREMSGAEAEIRRTYGRFSPDHPMHRNEPDYAPDYTSEGARVLTWRPATPVPLRMAA